MRATAGYVTYEVDVLDAAAFDALLQANQPTGRYRVGTAAGSPVDGLVRDVFRGREYASRHDGHGVMVPVAVLGESCTRNDPEWDDDCGCQRCVEERVYR